ncbi:MAG: uL30 family ribosomal protein [Candidatus Woesearchaeota archaeon]
MIAAIRIRGSEGIHRSVQDTLELLHLHKKNFCAIIQKKPSSIGMLRKAKDYITWGEIDDNTIKILYEKRGEEYKGNPERKTKYITVNGKKLKPFFRLHPPRGGFERAGIKQPYTLGGALGQRKDGISKLIQKMI